MQAGYFCYDEWLLEYNSYNELIISQQNLGSIQRSGSKEVTHLYLESIT